MSFIIALIPYVFPQAIRSELVRSNLERAEQYAGVVGAMHQELADDRLGYDTNVVVSAEQRHRARQHQVSERAVEPD